jgi:hypothetical protein
MVTQRLALALGLGMLAAGALAACSAIWGFQDLSPLPPDASTTDGHTDVKQEDVATEPDVMDSGCIPAIPPPPPDGGAVADAEADVRLVFALHTLDLGLDEKDLIGFDLDKVCTCPGRSSCVLPPSSFTGYACDRAGGRDIGSARLFGALGVGDPNLSETKLNEDINDGKFTFLISVSEYNGQANDPTVTLAFFNSPGMPDGGPPPAWDGSDVWPVYKDNVVGGRQPNYVSAFTDYQAYVSNYVLVGRFLPPFYVRLSPNAGHNDNYLELPLSDTLMTIPLVPDDAGAGIDGGIFGGRLASHDLLSSVSVLEDDAGFYCGSSSVYALLVTQVCPFQEIMANPSRDNTNASCDAISFAIGFTAASAQLGGEEVIAQVDASCPKGWDPHCSM